MQQMKKNIEPFSKKSSHLRLCSAKSQNGGDDELVHVRKPPDIVVISMYLFLLSCLFPSSPSPISHQQTKFPFAL